MLEATSETGSSLTDLSQRSVSGPAEDPHSPALGEGSSLRPFPDAPISSVGTRQCARRTGRHVELLWHRGKRGRMKRSKRNRIKRAFEKGYQLGLAGRSKENCPFLTGVARVKWLEGWREGRSDWREGLTDALTCYKLSGF